MDKERQLLDVLGNARDLGFLGPGPVEDHLNHALAYMDLIGSDWSGRAVDLGSGGGVPGLVLASFITGSNWVLVDSQERRAEFLGSSIKKLSLEQRVSVLSERAEAVGRNLTHRHQYDLVVARSFASPPITAECAAPLLKQGARLIVSEPPIEEKKAGRWPAEGLSLLGLKLELVSSEIPSLALIRSTDLCTDKYPRKTGIPVKRPLW